MQTNCKNSRSELVNVHIKLLSDEEEKRTQYRTNHRVLTITHSIYSTQLYPYRKWLLARTRKTQSYYMQMIHSETHHVRTLTWFKEMLDNIYPLSWIEFVQPDQQNFWKHSPSHIHLSNSSNKPELLKRSTIDCSNTSTCSTNPKQWLHL